MKLKATLRLENGLEFQGYSFGCAKAVGGEVVFNTSMMGYPEQLTDPTYNQQILCLTYPLIGNYGVPSENLIAEALSEKLESERIHPNGLIIFDYCEDYSNWEAEKSLEQWMNEQGLTGIYGIDTRELTRKIRDNGTCKVIFTSADTPADKAVEILNNTEIPNDAVKIVSCKKRWYSRTANMKYNVVAIDCGIKLSLIRTLNSKGCNITVVPYDTTAEEVMKMKPDGIYISDGPGNPEDIQPVIELVKTLRGKCPIIGVGLGSEIIGLAYGAKTYKLKAGHRGCNHSVRSLINNTLRNHLQNHGYAIDASSIEGTELTVTHINVFDKTVEGISCEKDNVYGVQYLPSECSTFYERFINLMKGDK